MFFDHRSLSNCLFISLTGNCLVALSRTLDTALWVMWGLLCGHLVAFKAPKSWPNKFLINVWGGFSVIFIASYTANIAALIAGLFFQNSANTYDSSVSACTHAQRESSFIYQQQSIPLRSILSSSCCVLIYFSIINLMSKNNKLQLMTQRVGIPRSTAAESFVQRHDKYLYERMKKHTFDSIEEGIKGLK